MTSETDWTQRLDSVSDESLGGIVVDEAFRIRAITDDVLSRTGLTEQNAVDKSVLDLFHPVDIGRAAAVIGRAAPSEKATAPGIYRMVSDQSTWDIYEMSVVHLGIGTGENGENGENAVLLEFAAAGNNARTSSLVDESIELTRILTEPQTLRESFREVADFAERNIDRLSLSITVFGEDGSSATFCQRDLDEETTATNAAAHPLSLPAHVVVALEDVKKHAWSSENEVGTIDPELPSHMTMVLLDLEENLLGYVDASRATNDAPKEEEWRVYRLVLQTLRAVMVKAQLTARLDYLDQNDPLTGLRNRNHLLTMMSSVDPSHSGVVALNLDGFSWVNEELGFEAGDTVLSSVAASIVNFMPPSAVTARLSGDEFLVWLPAITSADELFRIAEQLRSVTMVPIDNSDRRQRTRCSIGSIQVMPGEPVDKAIHRAVTAMAISKADGGDRVTHG